MSIINNGLLLASGADAPTTYQISRSIRLNSADSAYFSRTPGSAGNRKTWTWSGWVKRAKLGADIAIFSTSNGAGSVSRGSLHFLSTNVIRFWSNPSGGLETANFATNAVFRDPSAWYHIVFALDTTQATNTERIKIYVNNERLTASSATYMAQNEDAAFNQAFGHFLGNYQGEYGDFYLADVYFLDGTATTPSTFAETDAVTGQWVPKTPTGISYGTNGFRLTFSDNSGTTSTTLGKDAAGSNNWTPNNFSVASGSGNDSLVDSPTSYGTDTGAGGEVRGNYCTLNPLNVGSAVTLANGNLDASVASSGNQRFWGTIGVSTGKWYFEYTQTSGTYAQGVGIKSTFAADNNSNYFYSGGDGNKVNASGSSSAYGATWGNNDVIGVAFDLDAGTITFYKNGTSQGQAFSGLPSATYFPYGTGWSGGTWAATMNFGQRAWSYAPPSGFRALCDTNLTAPTIAKPANYFDVKLYTGNASTQTISGLGFSPDLVWIKGRNATPWHAIFDSVRGTGLRLSSNVTNAETGNGSTDLLQSFNSNGFTVNATLNGTGDTSVNWDGSAGGASTYVAWAWDAASSNSTNTSGTITSTVRANATAGFSIVTYTGTGANATIGHGCGAAPAMIIARPRATSSWFVYHASLGATKYLALNSTNAAGTSTDLWNSTAPTSTVFSAGNNAANASGESQLAYCFAPVAGYSALGSYTGNGSSDGVFVYTGFRVKFLLVKRTDTAEDWFIWDAARDSYNVSKAYLRPNLSDAENTTYSWWDFLSNGFKARIASSGNNASGGTYIYYAVAENPFQYARAR